MFFKSYSFGDAVVFCFFSFYPKLSLLPAFLFRTVCFGRVAPWQCARLEVCVIRVLSYLSFSCHFLSRLLVPIFISLFFTITTPAKHWRRNARTMAAQPREKMYEVYLKIATFTTKTRFKRWLFPGTIKHQHNIGHDILKQNCALKKKEKRFFRERRKYGG